MNKIFYFFAFAGSINYASAQHIISIKNSDEKNPNKTLAAQLDSIYEDDQRFRIEVDEIVKNNRWDSDTVQGHLKMIVEKDSINFIKVKSILEQYGWLGAEAVGKKGNAALFLVIQHSNLQTQEKYLPMMRAAVKSGNANGSDLALLEDRVLLSQGKKHIYGSQVAFDYESAQYFVLPLDRGKGEKKKEII